MTVHDRTLGNRFFRNLTDEQVYRWRPTSPRGMFGWSGVEDGANVSACNREVRRRAKLAGLDGPYAWVAAQKEKFGE